MQHYQRVTIEGNVCHNPTIKSTKTGKSICSFSMAVNHFSKNESDKSVSFFDIDAWDKLAEICSEHISKGRRLIVIGTLKQNRWEDGDGKKQSKVRIIAKEIRFLENAKKFVESEAA
jgi:single-strand DNA-binding protein